MWDWAIYGALIVGSVAVVSAALQLAVRVLRTWRDLKRMRRHVERELARLAELTELTAEKAESAADTERLERSIARLRVTLRRFALLQEAFEEATGMVGRLAFVYTRR